ncbi:VIT family-domain-containing protein [Achaetomium macrosporum]|uniref:VIT family-domain-containing protein n=1 Tax=Achaetomium macrosporum TaxID=79813 RepID=A0AAN7H5A5_9PEZI|nr:VIT family-domain-containing protein [Achaetomium macrosporum]
MSQVWRPVLEKLGLQPSGSRLPSSPSNSETLPLYSANTASEGSCPTMTNPLSEMGNDHLDSCTSLGPRTASSPLRGLFQLPTLSRFLADFTLGFADGLTVPFALTAGLSSLGRTDTVIYAGMAEICAGSISMGIGGYLSARGEVAAAKAVESSDAEEVANTDPGVQEEKGLATCHDVVASYLEPLDLPPQLREMVMRHACGCPAIIEALLKTQRESDRRRGEGGSEDERVLSPLLAGLSVAVGYLLGGVLPLFPYFFVNQVKDGLFWSFGVCAVALFVFGFCKDFALSGEPRKMRWSDIRRSAWEGTQMVVLGSVAALAAVLCVRAFEGIRVGQSEQTA